MRLVIYGVKYVQVFFMVQWRYPLMTEKELLSDGEKFNSVCNATV